MSEMDLETTYGVSVAVASFVVCRGAYKVLGSSFKAMDEAARLGAAKQDDDGQPSSKAGTAGAPSTSSSAKAVGVCTATQDGGKVEVTPKGKPAVAPVSRTSTHRTYTHTHKANAHMCPAHVPLSTAASTQI
jgi:hypothetical protein